MADVKFNTDRYNENSFSDISENSFFTAESFAAAGCTATKQLYYKSSPTQVINLEEQSTTKVKTSDILIGVDESISVEINVS